MSLKFQPTVKKRLETLITRKEIINWQPKVCHYYVEAIYNQFQKELIKQPILHADETPYTVLESEASKTYYWTFLSGKYEEKGITLYHHGVQERVKKQSIF